MDHSTFAVLKGQTIKRKVETLFLYPDQKKKPKKQQHTNKNNLINNDVSKVSFELYYYVGGGGHRRYCQPQTKQRNNPLSRSSSCMLH